MGFRRGFMLLRRVRSSCINNVDAAEPGSEPAKTNKQQIGRGPEYGLGSRGKSRLDQKGESQQAEQRSDIGKCKKTVGRAPGRAARVPRLNQRTGGAKQNKRQTDGKREQRQDSPCRVNI